MTEKNTAWLLAQWALWQREGVSLRMSARSPLAAMSKTACVAYVSSEICDEDALRVDRAMAQLKKHNPIWYKVLVWAFVAQLGPYQLATKMQLTRYSVGQLYEAAYMHVDRLLSLDGLTGPLSN